MTPLFSEQQLAPAEAARTELLCYLWRDAGTLRCYDRPQLLALARLVDELHIQLDHLLHVEEEQVQVVEDDGSAD